MKRGLWTVAAAALLAAAVGVASAQGPGGGRQGGRGGMFGGRGGGLGMLRVAEVQQELKMTQLQIEKIDAKQQELQEAMRQVMQEAGGNFQNMSQEDRQKLMTKGQELQIKAVSDILDTTQLVRYKQLELQQLGAATGLARKDVANALNLTEEQRAKLRDLQQKAMEKMRSMFQGGGNFQNMTPEERQKRAEEMQQMRKDNDTAALALLSNAQKAKWTAANGKPFKFPAPGPRRGGPGPGG